MMLYCFDLITVRNIINLVPDDYSDYEEMRITFLYLIFHMARSVFKVIQGRQL